jgi:hypothetical protein
VMWSQGLLYLIILFFLQTHTVNNSLWISWFKSIGCEPYNYLYNRIEANFVVYGKFQFSTKDCLNFKNCFKHVYFGSTSVSFPLREFNRDSKLKMLRHSKYIKAELALRWWSHYNLYPSFVSLILVIASDKIDALAIEHCYINKWQPLLNHPFVQKHLTPKAMGFKKVFAPVKSSFSLPGNRLFGKLRRKYLCQYKANPGAHLVSFTLYKMWHTTFSLGSVTRRSYNTAREIRSRAWTTPEVYVLYRVASHAEEPAKSLSRSIIKSALIFRDASIPK